MNPAQYFKLYREELGFRNQNEAKKFLSAKDLQPNIDFEYIDNLNSRIKQIIVKINNIVTFGLCEKDLKSFLFNKVDLPYNTIRKAGLLPRLNNQGRRPESVLFSWLRGYAITEYFTPAFAKIFDVEIESIISIGDDKLSNTETFRRTPTADLEIEKNNKKIRIEVQSGFQGINDIKEHKVREAKRVYKEQGIPTICVHIDLFNGQVAFVKLNIIEDNDINFVTRQQMEGQSVLTIDQNYFKWRLMDPPPSLEDLELNL